MWLITVNNSINAVHQKCITSKFYIQHYYVNTWYCYATAHLKLHYSLNFFSTNITHLHNQCIIFFNKLSVQYFLLISIHLLLVYKKRFKPNKKIKERRKKYYKHRSIISPDNQTHIIYHLVVPNNWHGKVLDKGV